MSCDSFNTDFDCQISLAPPSQFMKKQTAYFPALLTDLCLSILLANTAFYTNYLHLSSTFLGGLAALSGGIFVFLAIPFGRLSDRIERTRVLSVSCLLLACVSLTLPFCTRKLHLLIAFPCVGIGMALFWPAYEAWLADREGGGHLIVRVMTFNLFWSVGITGGPFISGYIYSPTHPTISFYIASGFSLLSWGAIYLHTKLHPENGQRIEAESFDASAPASQPTYRQIGRIANFASWFALGFLRQLAPKLMLDMDIAAKTYGNLMLALGIAQTLMFLGLGTERSVRWHYRLMPLIGIQILAVIGFVQIFFVPQAIFWMPAFAMVGLCAAATYFSSMYYGLHDQTDKGNKSGWHEAILGSGLLLGPFLGGILADSVGIKSPYLLCAGVIAISICIEVFIWARDRR